MTEPPGVVGAGGGGVGWVPGPAVLGSSGDELLTSTDVASNDAWTPHVSSSEDVSSIETGALATTLLLVSAVAEVSVEGH